MKAQLVKLEDGTIMLERNGKPLTCPHTQPAMIPPKFAGQAPTFQYMMCGSQCALFHYRENEGNTALLTRGCAYNEPAEKLKIVAPPTEPKLTVTK